MRNCSQNLKERFGRKPLKCNKNGEIKEERGRERGQRGGRTRERESCSVEAKMEKNGREEEERKK